MDGVSLIRRARDAGLRLEVARNALKITGPKEAEPFVRLLANHKAEVLEVLTNSGLRELRELRKIAPETLQGDLPPSVEEEARRDRFEERAAILEFDQGLPRAEAEGSARREMAGVYDDMQAEPDPGAYASALAVLRAERPAYVPEDRWRQAVADATAFISKWGAQAQAFGWTARELFGLHLVPERPAPSYRRLSRYDETGLIWASRRFDGDQRSYSGRDCRSDYRKINQAALGPVGDGLEGVT
jgi:DNA-binding transcriptional MerR regulator